MKKVSFIKLCTILLCAVAPIPLFAQGMSNRFAEKAAVVLLMDDEVDTDATKGTEIIIHLVPGASKGSGGKVYVKILDLETRHFTEDFVCNVKYKDDIDNDKNGIIVSSTDIWKVFGIGFKNGGDLAFVLSDSQTNTKKSYIITDVAFFERYSDFSMFQDFRSDNNLVRSYDYLRTFFKKVQPSR